MLGLSKKQDVANDKKQQIEKEISVVIREVNIRLSSLGYNKALGIHNNGIICILDALYKDGYICLRYHDMSKGGIVYENKLTELYITKPYSTAVEIIINQFIQEITTIRNNFLSSYNGLKKLGLEITEVKKQEAKCA